MAELEQGETVANPIGDRLKTAREAQGLNLDDIAAKTRVPIRHLLHIEKGEWEQLPAPTYTLGFARAYAQAVGLNPAEVSAELRQHLTSSQAPTPAYYEPADPARVPPRWLALVAAIVAFVLVAGYFIWRNETFSSEETAAAEQAEVAAPAAAPQPTSATTPAPTTASGPVVLTATDDVWLRVYDEGGGKLFESTMKPGDRYQIPAEARQPKILTGRPNALQVTVGATQIPPLGAPETTVSGVSLLAADLLARASSSPPAAAPAPSSATAPAPAARTQRTRSSAPMPAPTTGSAPEAVPPAAPTPPAPTTTP